MISTRPLSEHIGVEVQGINPQSLSDADKDALRDLFTARHLVLLRSVDLSPDDHLALTDAIGPVSQADAIMKDGRKFSHISNAHADGRLPDGELLYHADHMFLETPLKAISLYALQVPLRGGETCFLDAARAYRGLPEEIKTKIANLSARHVYDYGANRGNQAATRDAKLSDNSDAAIHPIVWPHPETSEPILFVSRLFTVEIIGLPQDEGDALLGYLFKHLEGYANDYVHPWRVGDLVIWDNRILQHARNDFDPAEKRALRRVPIA